MEWNSKFVGVLGDSPRVKIWEFLLVGRDFEYHITDIAKGSKISRPTCHQEISEMKKQELIIKGGKYKGKQLYKLNTGSKVVSNMIRAFNVIIKEPARKSF